MGATKIEWADAVTVWPLPNGGIGVTGPGARPMNPQWVRDIRDQCVAAGVPFFFKGWGEWMPIGDASECVPYDDYPHRKNHYAAFHAGENSGPFYYADPQTGCINMMRVGKKRSGRLLDGRTWDEYPKV